MKSLILSEEKRDKYIATYIPHQKWSLPDSVIYYITKNPSTRKCYQKMVQSCKYFFIKNPIIVADKLCFTWNNELKLILKSADKYIDFAKHTSKFWFSDEFNTCYTKASNFVSSVITQIYQCNVRTLSLKKQNISFSEFSFLIANVENVVFYLTCVKHEDGLIVPVEKLFKELVKVKQFIFSDNPTASSISIETVTNLLKIPHFSKINKLNLYNIPEMFDIETFFKYIKRNNHTSIDLRFDDSISAAYKIRLQMIVNEILEKITHEYYVPFISFNGENRNKTLKLYSRYRYC